MAIQPVVNKETGEKKEVSMSIHDINQWYSDNPDWQRDWQAGVAGCGEVGHWKAKVDNGFKDVLNNIKNHHPGATFDPNSY